MAKQEKHGEIRKSCCRHFSRPAIFISKKYTLASCAVQESARLKSALGRALPGRVGESIISISIKKDQNDQGNPSCPPQSYPPSNKGLIRPY